MPTISFDAQSLLIDGRRIWLVSGEFHYARIPHELWRSRLIAARQAGLNCITTSVPWHLHEPRPGVFEFEGQLDLNRFVKLVGELGMYCILRPGPYVGDGYDLGGLPAWLLAIEGMKLRQAPGLFMERVARYFGQLLDEIKDLQVTTIAQPGYNTSAIGSGGGPIVLMQAEHLWFCHYPQQGEAYLKELTRYLRESGCQVPITLANNLWQRTEGTIDTWVADDQLFSELRQLAVVQPHAPRMVSRLPITGSNIVGSDAPEPISPEHLLTLLAQVLASGSQYNLTHIQAGLNFVFMGGRELADAQSGFATAHHAPSAPVSITGSPSPAYFAIKLISTFANQFGHILAGFDTDKAHATFSLDISDHPPAIVHLRGSQGHLVFIFRGTASAGSTAQILLPTGQSLPVPLSADGVQWLLAQVNLGGQAHLDFTNLCPWAFLARRMLVLFGHAGSQGLVSLNGAVLEIFVPKASDKKPWIGQHEGITLVVLNREQMDCVWVTPQGLLLGALELDENDQPLTLSPTYQSSLIQPDGDVTPASVSPSKTSGKGNSKRAQPARGKPVMAAPALAQWETSDLADYLAGTAAQFKTIPGPASLESLVPDAAYCWYRLTLPEPQSDTILAPGAADRVHLYQAGQLKALLGVGQGAESAPVKLQLADTVVALADTPGRFCDGWRMHERKGLFDHLYAVKPVVLGKPKRTTLRGFDPWPLSHFWSGLHHGDHHPCQALSWQIKTNREQSLIVQLNDVPGVCLLLCNGKAVGLYGEEQSSRMASWTLHPAPGNSPLKPAGTNELSLVLLQTELDDQSLNLITRGLSVFITQQNLTRDAQWAFAPWAIPDASTFVPMKAVKPGQPRWYRTEFDISAASQSLMNTTSLALTLQGMSKGQVCLNGRNLCRYWWGTLQGKPISGAGSLPIAIPSMLLHSDQANQLLIFDEHGCLPSKVAIATS